MRPSRVLMNICYRLHAVFATLRPNLTRVALDRISNKQTVPKPAGRKHLIGMDGYVTQALVSPSLPLILDARGGGLFQSVSGSRRANGTGLSRP